MVCSNHSHRFSKEDLKNQNWENILLKNSNSNISPRKRAKKCRIVGQEEKLHLLIRRTRSSRGPRRGQRCNKHSANMPSLLRRSRLPVDDNDENGDNDNNEDDHDKQIQQKA